MDKLIKGLVLLLGLVAPAPAQDYSQSWHWLVVTPDDQANWKIQQGDDAAVEVHGDRFMASLGQGAIRLNGSIRNHRITAVETLVGTDAGPMTFHGEWQIERTRISDPSSGWGSDRISLHAPGGFVLGLVRHVRTGAPPGR